MALLWLLFCPSGLGTLNAALSAGNGLGLGRDREPPLVHALAANPTLPTQLLILTGLTRAVSRLYSTGTNSTGSDQGSLDLTLKLTSNADSGSSPCLRGLTG